MLVFLILEINPFLLDLLIPLNEPEWSCKSSLIFKQFLLWWMEDMVKYRKVPKFVDARKLRCNLPKFQTKWPNLRVFRQKGANGIANSEDPDQTAPLGAV